MAIELVKLFLEIIKESKDIISKNSKKDDSVTAGTLLKLFGSGKKLVGLLNNYLYGTNEESQDFSEHEKVQIDKIIEEIHDYGVSLRALNLYAIDVCHSELGTKIGRVVGYDVDLLKCFTMKIPEFGLDSKKIPKIISLYVKNFDVSMFGWKLERKGLLNIFRSRIRWPGSYPEVAEIKKEDIISLIKDIHTLIVDCNQLIGEIIKENWTLKEVLSVK